MFHPSSRWVTENSCPCPTHGLILLLIIVMQEKAVIPFVPSNLFLAAKWTLDLLDDWGERLAYFFGITSPKYAVEISAHQRSVKQEQARKENQEQQFSGWSSTAGVAAAPAGVSVQQQSHGYENPVMHHPGDGSQWLYLTSSIWFIQQAISLCISYFDSWK